MLKIFELIICVNIAQKGNKKILKAIKKSIYKNKNLQFDKNFQWYIFIEQIYFEEDCKFL